MKYSLGVLERSLVFPILLFSSISLHWSLRKAFLSLLIILWNSAFKWEYLSFSPLLFASFTFSAICKALSGNHFAFLHFFSWGWSWSLPLVRCHEPPSIVLQALCLSDLIPWLYFSLPLCNHKGFDLGHTWMNGLVVFPTLFNLSLNLNTFLHYSYPSQILLLLPRCLPPQNRHASPLLDYARLDLWAVRPIPTRPFKTFLSWLFLLSGSSLLSPGWSGLSPPSVCYTTVFSWPILKF